MTESRAYGPGDIVRWQSDGFRGSLTMAAGKANALRPELVTALSEALNDLEAMPPDLVVLTGEDRFFSAGLDLVTLHALERTAFESFCQELDALFLRLYELPTITVAAVNGHAVAGGAVLMLCCDRRIASAGPAKIGLNETQLGLPFPGACLDVLESVLAPSTFASVVLTGRMLSVDEAQGLGLIDEVVPPEALAEAIDRFADPLRSGGPTGRRAIKRSLRSRWRRRCQGGWAERNAEFVDLWFSGAACAERAAVVARLKK